MEKLTSRELYAERKSISISSQANERMPMRQILMIAGGGILGFLVLAWLGSTVVNQDEIALQYKWGILDDVPLKPGFHILWPGYKVVVFDNTKHAVEIAGKDPDETVVGIAAQ